MGVKEKGAGGGGADFPTVYMLISNLTDPVLELFIHQMQIIFPLLLQPSLTDT